jgi:hypothetical protein
VREVGGGKVSRGQFWGREGDSKIPVQGFRVFWVHPQNGLNGLILN